MINLVGGLYASHLYQTSNPATGSPSRNATIQAGAQNPADKYAENLKNRTGAQLATAQLCEFRN